MIIYFKCLCTSRDKQTAKRLVKEGHDVRVIRSNPEYRDEAKSYGLRLPIAVENGKARRLYE